MSGSIFRNTKAGRRPDLPATTTSNFIRHVRSCDELKSAIDAATFLGPVPFEGLSRLPGLGQSIVIVEPIEFCETIVIPTRCFGLTISQAARFTCISTHTGPLFEVRSLLTRLSGLSVAPAYLATEEPSHVILLEEADADLGGGGAAYCTFDNCTVYGERLIATAAGVTSKGVTVRDNNYFTIGSTTTDGINLVGDEMMVAGNSCGDQCDVTFALGSTSRICNGNNLAGGVVTNADVGAGLNT